MKKESPTSQKGVARLVHKSIHFLMYCVFALSVLLLVTLSLGEFTAYRDYYTTRHNFFLHTDLASVKEAGANMSFLDQTRAFLKQASHDHVSVTQYETKKGFLPSVRSIPVEQSPDIIALDSENMVITVSSAMSVSKLQVYLAQFGLTLPVITPISNARVSDLIATGLYASDVRSTFGGDVLRSFRLLTPQGEVVNVSRAENPDLFRLVLGGQGLFGVVLDVEFKVSENAMLVKKEQQVPYKEFPQYFYETIYARKDTSLFVASLTRSEGVLPKKLTVSMWEASGSHDEPDSRMDLFTRIKARAKNSLLSERYLSTSSMSSRTPMVSARATKYDVLTTLEKYFTVNEVEMHEVTNTSTYTYVIPVRNFIPFMNYVYALNEESKLVPATISIMYSPAIRDALLTPNQKEDSFVITITDVRDVKDIRTDEVINETQKQLTSYLVTLGGAQSLLNPYYPSFNDLQKEYPGLMLFLAKKKQYDPQDLFVNAWYRMYK